MKYEYLSAGFDGSGFSDYTSWLNSLGEQGWELVAVSPLGYGNRVVFYFKRPLA